MIIRFTLSMLALCTFSLQAQVGINTLMPRELLDVNGNAIVAGNSEVEGNMQVDGDANVDGNASVTNNITVGGNGEVTGYLDVGDYDGRSAASVMGVTADGKLQRMNVAGNLEMNSNTIIASGSGYYFITNVPVSTPVSNTRFDNWDLGIDGQNAYKTVIRFTGATASFRITGLAGGVEGRHLILLNATPENMEIVNESQQSLPANRFDVLSNSPSASTQGYGAIELVYDGSRWVVLAVRD